MRPGTLSSQRSKPDPEDRGAAPEGPLAGIRVIELGGMLAGPFAGRLLGDLGADVIKVEPPGKPDSIREWGRGQIDGKSLLWPVLVRNKRCITLNLREARGQELLVALVREADVLIENFRPGTLERWNLGPDVLEEANPRLVIARVSGYGQTGPYAERAGFASVGEAMGGLRHLNGNPGEAPPRLGVSLGDSLAGMFAVQGILAALHERDVRGSGRGQVVDVSILESCFAMLEDVAPEYDRLDLVRQPSGTSLKGIAPSNLYRSRDGTWMVIAANRDNLFRRLCDVMGRPELAEDERYATHTARGERQEELDALIAAWAAEHDAAELDAGLNAAGVVAGPVYTIADIFSDPHFQAREMLVEHDDTELGPVVGPGIVPKLSRTPGSVRWSGPWAIGHDNADVFGELAGVDADELSDLADRGIV
jgi:succinyl-CoA---D-citramalate CoA-transferase